MNKSENFKLLELIESAGNKSVARKLTPILDDLEKAIAAGVTHEKIIASLKDQGMGEIPLTAFRQALYRLRKAKSKAKPSLSGAVALDKEDKVSPQTNPQEKIEHTDQAHKPVEGTMSWNELKKIPFQY